MPFRCRICFLGYDDDSLKTDGLVFMGVLTHVCKECKRTGNTKRNTTHCAFCDEKHDILQDFDCGDGSIAHLCKRCYDEEITKLGK